MGYSRIYIPVICGLCMAAAVCRGEQAMAAGAGDTPKVKPDSVYLIDDIEIVARRNLDVIPAQTLSGEELKLLGNHSLADAIRYFAGIEMKDYGGIGGMKTVNVRSMGSKHVGVFYDGVQMTNAQNGVIDLGRLSLDNVEAVSIHNGQKSALFQSAKDFASASTIYLATRRPVFEGGRKNNFKATVRAGSFALVNPSVLWESALSEKVSMSLNGEFLSTSGRYKYRLAKRDGYDTTMYRENGDARVERADANFFGIMKGGDWKAKLYFYDSERGYPGATVRGEPGVFKRHDRQWDTNVFAQASVRRRVSGKYSFQASGKYAYDYLHYVADNIKDVTLPMRIDNTYRQQEAYASSSHEFTLNRVWTANLACDFQYNRLDSDMRNFAFPSRYTLLTAAATSLQLEKVSLQASLLHTYVDDRAEISRRAAGRRSAFSPALIASYRPWRAEDITFRAFYKHIFRMPTFNELYYTEIVANELQPEYTVQYNLGAAYGKDFRAAVLKKLDLSLDLYYNEIENMIVAIPASSEFRWQMLNLDQVEIRGADVKLTAGWQAGCVWLATRLTYTFQDTRVFDSSAGDDFLSGYQIPYIPRHSGVAVLNAGWGRWSLSYSFIYTGERYLYAAGIPRNYIRPWYTHDMALSGVFAVGGSELTATAEINNIFNQTYEVVKNFPMPGTNFKIILSLRL